MPRGSSPKRERQYEEIKKSEKQRGVPEKRAEEIAARTVNKARARAGEAAEPSKLSKTDISSQQRAAYRRKHGGSGRTRDQLYEEAKDRNISGRSKMSKAQLERALSR
ncbi:MAG: hypothetical protein JWL73_2731 [Actinomycetia bacterium]|nr:hypothetical protein [Actinomycetes bacterium]